MLAFTDRIDGFMWRHNEVCRLQESRVFRESLGTQTALVGLLILTEVTRIVGGRRVLAGQVGRQVHAVMQDAANLDLILVGEAINQEVTRAANSTESLFDVVTAVPKVIGAGDTRDFTAWGAA